MKKQTILIIEDNIFVSNLLNQILCNKYNTHIEENGYNALAFLQKGNIPDLIISDLTMPKLSGQEFLNIIKSSDFFNEIPLLILSGIDSSKERIACLKGGADDFMLKPFNPEELILKVSKLFNRNHKHN
jgi:DNA-binding response OmpR family regulator